MTTNTAHDLPATVQVPVSSLQQLHATLDALAAGNLKAVPPRSARRGRSAPARGAAATQEQPEMNQVTATVSPPAAVGSVVGHNVNPLAFEPLREQMREWGALSGKSKDVQIKAALRICESAAAGHLDLTPDKHGAGKNDAAVLGEDYAKSQNSAIIFDARAANQRKLISNFNKCIRFASSPKWGIGQPMGNINLLLTVRQNLRKQAKAGAAKLDDAFNILMRYATAQLKDDTLFTQQQLEQMCYKNQSEPRTAEDVLRSIQKLASNLKSGKVPNCADIDTSAEVASIIAACNKRITTLVKAKSGQTP
jgi:hypothetical protein